MPAFDAVRPRLLDRLDADTAALSHDELTGVLGLNLLWTDGTSLAGSRLNRTLWARERTSVPTCSVCGKQHADPPEGGAYRAVALASERITDEPWTAVPNGSVFAAGRDATLQVEPIGGDG